jgi:uncharacterized protein YqjF (DUF2071 family)
VGVVEEVGHRPWPVPARPWVMTQTWHNLLFAHWPCSPDALRLLLPRQITLDTFAGQAWVGIIAFRMTGIRLHGCPVVPMVERFPEINVRTYVTENNRPGVYFLSLDTNNPITIAIARSWFRLAYQHARVNFEMVGDTVHFHSTRVERSVPGAQFSGSFRPTSDACIYKAGTLEHWLTERYCYYSTNRRGDTVSGEVHHPPWPLQIAEASITMNTMAASHGIQLPDCAPLLHYAHYVKALIWNARRLAEQAHPVYPAVYGRENQPVYWSENQPPF